MLFSFPVLGCKMISVFIFTFKYHFLENRERAEWEGDRARAQREREREKRSNLEPRSQPRAHFAVRLHRWTQSPSTSHPSTSPFDFDFKSHPDHNLWLRQRTQSPSTSPFDFNFESQLRNGWVLMNLTGFDEFFLVGFCFGVYQLRNGIIHSFGNRENVRKYEQQVENVFSMVFSRTQPNTRKYFSKNYLICNQTHENIFLSGK